MTISPVAVAAAFFAVANDQNSLSYHGKWIPADYWAYLCCTRLQTTAVKATKLRKALEAHIEQDELLNASIIHGLGCVVKVEATTRHLRLGGDDGRKRSKPCLFIRVQTAATLAATDTFPTDNVEAQAAFMDLYHTYVDMIEPIASTPPLTIDTAMPSTENSTQRQGNNQTETQPVRPVTPEPQTALDLDCNADIRKLFVGVLHSSVLKQPKLFVGDGSIDLLRERIREHGMKLQLQKNREKYNALAPEDTLADEIDCKKYEPFLNSFCCPINSRAIQGIVAIALQIAQENGGNGTIQLHRVNGGTGGNKKSRGLGKRVLALVPSNN